MTQQQWKHCSSMTADKKLELFEDNAEIVLDFFKCLKRKIIQGKISEL